MRGWLLVCLALWAGAASAQGPAILDTDRLPPMQAPGEQGYRERFLVGNLPRAWAIASNGAHGGEWGGGSIERARERAPELCG